ncbi:hypothetical protein CLU79DRAFT_839797 [Phycomyces nitens]|nr:hypothetical protein CLU79DRAFT_839797 [Phycomyces nitens]
MSERSRSRSRSKSPKREPLSPTATKYVMPARGEDDDDERDRRHRTPSPRRGHHRSYSRSPSRSPHHRRSSSRRRHSSRRRYASRSPHRSSRRYSRSPPPRKARTGPSQPKECRVYVGNLSYDTKWHHLKDFMREAGTVMHADILTLANGRSKGCGVVEYKRPEDAQNAIRLLHKTEFMGRPVFVREDLKSETPGSTKEAPEECQLFVGNLPYFASWQDLKDLFRKAGRVRHTDIVTDPETRRSSGRGLVIFDDPQDARSAIEMYNGYEWQGRRLEVCEERNRPPPRASGSESRSSGQGLHRDSGRERSIENYRSSKELSTHVSQPPPPPPVTHYDNYDNSYRYQDGGAPHAGLPMTQIPQMNVVGGPGASLPSIGANQIYVKNLPYSTTWQDLIDLFRHVGPVVRAEIILSGAHPKGSGLVRFEDFQTCERAIDKFNGYLYGGRHLDIRLDRQSTCA